MLNKRKQYKKETERGGNADAEPVALVALVRHLCGLQLTVLRADLYNVLATYNLSK